MDLVSLSFKAISAAGGSLGTEIAKRLSNGMNIDALKSKEDKVIDELKNLQKSIESSKNTTLKAMRMQTVIAADNRVSGCLAELERAVKVSLPLSRDQMRCVRVRLVIANVFPSQREMRTSRMARHTTTRFRPATDCLHHPFSVGFRCLHGG